MELYQKQKLLQKYTNIFETISVSDRVPYTWSEQQLLPNIPSSCYKTFKNRVDPIG